MATRIELDAKIRELEIKLTNAENRVKELIESNKKNNGELRNWQELGERVVEELNPNDLCDTGKGFLREVNGLLGNNVEVDEDLTFTLRVEGGQFKLPGKLNPLSTHSYVIKIFDSEGNELYEEEPDNVEEV